MIVASSLIPLAGTVLCLTMAVLAIWTSPHRRSLRVSAFVAMNLSIAVWGFATFVFANLADGISTAAVRFGTIEYWAFAAMVIGLHGSAVYWFIFSAAYASHERYTTRTSLAWLNGLVLLGAILSLTNPWHHLHARPVDGVLAHSVLSVGVTLLLYGLTACGAIFLFDAPVYTLSARRDARIAATAAVVSAIGAVAWTLRRVLGLNLALNPAPVLFAVFASCMGYLVFARGFGGISTNTAELAFQHASDALIATDTGLCVVSLNSSAARHFTNIATGTCLDDAWPELALIAREALTRDSEVISFDIRNGEKIFEGRVEGAYSRSSGALGCVIDLVDVTELRIANQALADLETADLG